MIEQKPSMEGEVSHSSKPRLSLTSPCERAATLRSAPSAAFSDTKVLNVVTRSRACYLGKAKNPNASILEMLEPFTHKFCGRAKKETRVNRKGNYPESLTRPT